MTYKETVDYLYSATPQFQLIGAGAYKPGLDTIKRLAEIYGYPYRRYHTIHVAGTNGKGSVSHTLAAVLQSAGYRTGLFTSPHLTDFRERIRIDGRMVSKHEVVQWIEDYISKGTGLSPSFFELTTVMAFDLFAKHHVDVAVIEVGLGGRLDSTNIITPDLSIITNISVDHIAQLGHSLSSIAFEKAGIIKQGVPVILGEGDIPEVREVIENKAIEESAPLVIASDNTYFKTIFWPQTPGENIVYTDTPFGDVESELTGACQPLNAATILAALEQLKKLGYSISPDAVRKGFKQVINLTGLRGRWTVLNHEPLVICDTGHNEGGMRTIVESLEKISGTLRIVIGFVNDKEIDKILDMLPAKARYYFTQASVPRALSVDVLSKKAAMAGLKGSCYASVSEAIEKALDDAKGDMPGSMLFVGGSNFIVADALEYFPTTSCVQSINTGQ